MLLGRVIGTVVPSMLVDEISATPLLWVQPLTRDGKPEGVGNPDGGAPERTHP